MTNRDYQSNLLGTAEPAGELLLEDVWQMGPQIKRGYEMALRTVDDLQSENASARRRIFSVLRQATRVMGPGQKSRIGRLGGGAAIGAIVASFAAPAMAQYSAGGGSATGANSVAIGTGATATHIGGIATGTGNTATGDNAVAVGNGNTVSSFSAGGAIITNQILDRSIGGTYTFPVGGTGVVSSGLAVGTLNTVASAGMAYGTSNQVNGGGVAALAVGLGNATTGGFGVTLGVGNRSSATSAIAIGTATTASANTAIAIGRQSTASGQTSVAFGNVATANQTNAIAIGHSTQATGLGSIAVGGGNNGASTNLDATATRASGLNSIALGTSADALDRDTVGIGTNATAGNEGDVALGAGATANSDVNGVNAGATAIGMNAVANNSAGGGNNSVAIGRQAIATSTAAAGSSPTAIGSFANATGAGSQVAIGDGATASGPDAIAIGGHAFAAGSVASGVRSTAIGQSVTASGQSAIAIGDGAIAAGPQSIAIGTGNNVTGASSGAIGDPTTITGTGSYSLGNDNTINANNAFAIGNSITIAAGRDGSVGIGNNTTVAAAVGTASATAGDITLTGFAGSAPASTVSFGATGTERTLTNVAAGRVSNTSTDAINGSQLYSLTEVSSNLANSLELVTGGGLVLDASGNIATSPSFTVAGVTHTDVNSAFDGLDDANTIANTGIASAFGGGMAFDPDGTPTAPAYTIGGTTYDNVGDALGALATGGASTKYFHANSTLVDSSATGPNSVAVGPLSVASGISTIASGHNAQAIGNNSTAYGNTASASSDNSTALGANTTAGGISSTAIGNSVTANGNFATAVGMGSSASQTNSFAAGRTATASGPSSVAIGHDVVASAADTVAIGHSSSAVGPGSVSIGLGQTSTGRGSVAIGDPNTSNGTGAVVLGADSVAAGNAAGTTAANGAVAIGNANQALGQGSVAIGNSNDALGAGSVAIGDNATATNARDVALGSGSVTAAPHVGDFSINGGTVAGATSFGVASVGAAGSERQIQNVAAGVVSATSTDAVNGSQLYLTELATNNLGESIKSVIGAGLDLDVDGTIITAPGFTVAGGTQSNVGGAFDALDDANTLANNGITSAIGGSLAIAADGTVTAPTFNVNGTTHNNVADALSAAGAGFNFTTGATGTGVANGTSVSAIGAGETQTVTAGDNIITTQSGNDVAIALNPALTGITSLAVTGGPTFSGTGINMNGDGITGLAAGSTAAGSTDAINGDQLNTGLTSIADNLGGGVTFNSATGQLTAPGYAIDGVTYNNVGDALTALAADSKYVDFNSTLAAANASGVNASAVGPNAQAAGNNASAIGVNSDAVGTNSLALGSGAVSTGNNSVALGSGSQAGTNNGGWTGTVIGGVTMTNAQNANAVVSVSGGTTSRQITGVADGAVNATSTDAVNGAQLFNTANALDAKATNLGAGFASSLGGGASVAANGAVTAPTFSVNGTTHNNVADALSAAGAGFNFTTSATGTGVANGTSASTIGSGETHTVTAGDNIITTQSGNDVAIALNPALTGIASLAVTGGPTLSGTGINMNGDVITGLAAGSLAAGSTEAVNGGQFYTGLSSVATNLGGGSTFNPATGVVTSPNYVIGGTTYTDVGSALGGLASGGAKQRYFNANSSLPDSTAVGVDSIAIGPNAAAINAGDVALGNGSLTAAPNTGAFTLNGGAVAATAPTSVLSIGAAGNERQIQNIAAGVVSATSTDAVNGSQLFTVATAANNLGDSLAAITGGGLTLNADGTIATPAEITVGGVVYNNTTDAVEAGDAKADLANTGFADALGGGAAVAADGTVTAPAYNLSGSTYNTVGDALTALASGGAGPIQYADAATPSTPNGGFPSQNLTLVGATAAPVTLDNVAPGTLTAGSTQAVNGGQVSTLGSSVATQLGAGSTFDPATGQVTATAFNVAGGTQTNVGDAFAALDSKAMAIGMGLTDALGGGAAMAPDGTITPPSITVAGTAYHNVTDAIEAEDAKANEGLQDVADALGGGATYDPSTGAITNPSYVIAGTTYNTVGDAFGGVNTALTNLTNGTSGLVQQVGGAPGTGQITIGAATGGTSVSVAGTDGDRTVTGVAAGALSPTSTDAVNGSQVNALASSLADNLGGGSTFDPITGTVTAPVYNVAGGTQNNVGDALTAIDMKAMAIGTGLVNSLGGGAAIAPDGTVTGPAYTLGGNTYNTVGDALTSLANGGAGPLQYANPASPSTPNGGVPSNAVTLVGAAAGPVTVSNVAAGSTAAGSNQAINGSQLNTGLASVATSLGGGSTYDPATGSVTVPDYYVAGGTQNSVGAALTAIDMKAMAIGSGLASSLGSGAAVAPDGTVTNPTYTIAGNSYNNVGGALDGVDAAITNLTNGTTGLVQQSGGAPGTGQITVGANTGGTVVNVAGTEGNRTVTGVAPASLAATSADAVNGGQINTLATSTAAALGGGATFDPTTGQVTAPSYTVGGVSYTNAGDAFAASQRSGVQYVADAAGNPTNAVNLGNGVVPVSVTNLAPGAVNAASRDAVNGGQLYAVQQTAQSAVQYDRNADGSLNRSVVTYGTPGTPVQLRNVANGVAASDGVNLGQLQSGLASGLGAANAYTDGRIQSLSFDLGKVAKRAYAGTASAIALQPPALFEPGQMVMRGGVGAYRGEWAMGLSWRATADNGRWSFTGGISGGPNAGVAASAGIDFILGD